MDHNADLDELAWGNMGDNFNESESINNWNSDVVSLSKTMQTYNANTGLINQ